MSIGKLYLLCFLLASAASAAASGSFAEFDARAKAGEKLNVVYFGASLTFSANATDPSVTGFRGLMSEYLEQRYPKAHFRFHDAAIGGTTSKLGLFRMERDVLSKKPDLVFLDFVCNDGGDNVNPDNTCAYEQILRTLIGNGIPVEQVLFTFRPWMEKDGDYERIVPRHRLYRELAAYYGTPCGDAAKLIRAKLEAKETTLDAIWPIDGGHPGDYGYSLFFEAAKAAFEQAVSDQAECKVPSDPLYGSVEDVSRRPLSMFVAQPPAGWRQEHSFRLSMWYDGLSSRFLGDWVTRIDAQAESVGIAVKGNVFAFFGEADGKTALPFEVTIDDGKPKKVNFTHGCDGRLFVFRELFADGWKNGAGGDHVLSIKPIPDPKKPNGEVRIESVMSGTFKPTALALEIAKLGSVKDFDLDAIDHARGKAAAEGRVADDRLSVFISDIHVGSPGIPTPYGVQPASPSEYFEKTVDEILALDPRPKRVVCFGDIALWFGFKKDYELSLRGFKRLKEAGIDLFLTMGNHDKRQVFGSVYPGYAERSPVPGRFVSVIDLGTCDLILLDSLQEGDPEEGKANPVDGTIDRAQWDWLEAECMKRNRPFLCGSHHAPEELALEIDGKSQNVLSFLRNAPFFRGWIHGHAHTWATEIMVKGWCDRTVFRKAVLPSTGHWGDIGYALMRTASDRAELSLAEKDFFFPAVPGPGEERPRQWTEIVEENRGRKCAFIY